MNMLKKVKVEEIKEEEKKEEMTDAQKESIVYKSKLLNKYFDTWEELQKAEEEYKKANEEKLKAVEEKKTRAKEVEDAYLEYVKSKAVASEMISKAQQEANKLIADAESKWIELRDAFAKDYNGYHMTYTNNNGKEEIKLGDVRLPVDNYSKTFQELLKDFYNLNFPKLF